MIRILPRRHCRSDTHLGHSVGDLIPRRLTKSAPNIESRQDADGFALPLTPASAISYSYRVDNLQVPSYAQSVTPSDISRTSTSSNRNKSLVGDPLYRDMNLAVNNIYVRPSYEQFQEDIAGLC